MTKPVFNIIAEYPQVKHVTGQMRQASMHKHAGQEGKPHRYQGWHQARHFIMLAGIFINISLGLRNYIVPGKYLGGYGGISVGEHCIGAHLLEIHKNKNVGSYQQVVDERFNGMPAVVIR